MTCCVRAERELDLLFAREEVSMLTPYPTELPTESMAAVIAALRGRADVPHLVHHGWHVTGYGLGQLVPDAAVARAAAAVTPLTADQAADYLQAAAEGTRAVIPWSLVIPVVLDLIQRRIRR